MATLRDANKNDCALLVALEKECFVAPWTEGLFLGAFTRTDFYALVLEEQGEIVGYICGTSLFETADIARVCVAKAHRRKGYGARLLDGFENKARSLGAERVFLEVRVSNEPAQALYTSRGYEKGRIRQKYYADGEDGLEMKKEL